MAKLRWKSKKTGESAETGRSDKKNKYAFAGFGRLIFANPDFANQILREGKLDSKKSCLACSKCTELMRNGSTPGCVIRDSLYTELYRTVFSGK